MDIISNPEVLLMISGASALAQAFIPTHKLGIIGAIFRVVGGNFLKAQNKE